MKENVEKHLILQPSNGIEGCRANTTTYNGKTLFEFKCRFYTT